MLLKEYRPIFSNRKFMMIGVSESMSRLGDMAQGIALAAYVYTISQSSFIFGLFLLLRFMPQFVLLPFTGGIADRYSRRYTTTLINLLLALISVLMAVFDQSTTAILILALLAGIVNLPYRPAMVSSFPAIVRDDHLPLANGFLGMMNGVARIAGAVIATVGLMTGSVVAVMIFNAVTFFLSAIASWYSLPTKNLSDPVSEDEEDEPAGEAKPIPTLMDCLRYLWEVRTLRLLVMGSTLLWGCLSLSDVLLVPILGQLIDGGEQYYGAYRLVAAIGMAVGAYYSVQWQKWFIKPINLPYGYTVPILVLALSTVGLALWPLTFGWVCYFLIWVMMFLPSTMLEVELQRTPNEMRGRLISLADAVDGGLFIALTTVLPLIAMDSTQNLLMLSAIPFILISGFWFVNWLAALLSPARSVQKVEADVD